MNAVDNFELKDMGVRPQVNEEPFRDKARTSIEEGKRQDTAIFKGPAYCPYQPGYVMVPNMNNDPYLNNGSLSPPAPRTVSHKTPSVLLVVN
ncbi:hypothetical protein chiPu_0008555 [Chiloscyllium punctatum]|uniref:CTNNB1 binding N-teminal domain-containing protein n=1 Tax=Chiloscyllium punctatum TaxID=137246 RepID=A0A401SI72_CHIPU|nr:hypothetical protein [Chiloscyllium punctatum]